MLYPDAVNMFYCSLWQYLPSSILKLTRFTPSRVYARCRRMNAAFAKIGQPLYFSNAGEPLASREGKKDLMSVLGASFPPKPSHPPLASDPVSIPIQLYH